MTKLVAVHLLHLAGLAKGTVDIIEPGQVFDAREDELGLLKGGLQAPAREYNHDSDSALKRATRAGAAAVGKGDAGDGNTAPDITKLKKADLIAVAKAEGVEIDESATIAVILKAVQDARAEKAYAASDDAI